MSIKVCELCEKEFTTMSKRSKARFCSQDCRNEARKKQIKEEKALEDEVHYAKGFKPGDIPPNEDIPVYTNRTKREGKPILIKFLCTNCVIKKFGNKPGHYEINGWRIYGTYHGTCPSCNSEQEYNETVSPHMRFYIKLPKKGEPHLDEKDIGGAKELYHHYAKKALKQ